MSFIVLKSGNKNHRERNGDSIVAKHAITRIRISRVKKEKYGEFLMSVEVVEGQWTL